MTTVAARTRHRQRVEELCAAAVRALSGDPHLRFRGGRLHRGAAPYPATAPHLRPSPDQDDFASFRGAADGLALRRLYSDPDLHLRLSPDADLPQLVFEMLEQFRVEALAPQVMPGVATNLRHRHVTWSLAFHQSGLTDTAAGILLYTVAQICRSRVTGEPVVAETEDLLEATRFGLAPAIGKDLAALRRHRTDQAAYAVPARAIAEHVAALVAETSEDDAGDGKAGAAPRDGFSLLLDDADGEEPARAESGDSRVLREAEDGYRAFTRAYDRQHEAASLVRPALLTELRQRLDGRVARQGVNVPRLALRLKSLLAEPAPDGWEFGQEQGMIDGRRLARLVTSPAERRLFRTERIDPVADCLVTFLVDCSGSMRRHHETLALILDVLARALDLAGVTTELLGFTTAAWNGGRAMRDWRKAGRPPHPGRLNELCHLVFKDADTSWRRARRGIAAMLKDDLYREGVDGEAVTWACGRMRGRPERRRILVVVSDGSPMDGATNLTNDEHYLDHHLRDVVAATESAGLAHVHGLGVGLDLSPYYSRSRVLDLDRGVDNGVFRDIADLLADRGER
jgi:cobaltochelatase CobT